MLSPALIKALSAPAKTATLLEEQLAVVAKLEANREAQRAYIRHIMLPPKEAAHLFLLSQTVQLLHFLTRLEQWKPSPQHPLLPLGPK